MSAKIVVAGAGHGGIAAAALLARKGYDVTLVEQHEEAALGYDWRDCIQLYCFEETGLEPPPESELEPLYNLAYFNPRKTVCIPPRRERSSVSMFIERKYLVRHLLRLAGESGVRLRFSCRAESAVMDGTRVVGLKTADGVLPCDLLIDAAGMDSPVRRSLPDSCGIQREISRSDTLYTYRALFEDTGESADMPIYCAYFYHCGNKGFNWVFRDGTYIDVLVGSVGGITPQIVENALSDFRADHPYLGQNLLRGGAYSKIPLRRTLPQFVCDGYAAIGDSAVMIEPLSGSGLTMSIRSAAYLCSAVEAAKTFSRAELWAYEEAYFRRSLHTILHDDALKDVMMQMGEKNMDAMFEKKVITTKELNGGKQTASDMWHKAIGVLTTPSVAPALLRMVRRGRIEPRVIRSLPHEYDAARVAEWQRAYVRY
ncbi:MAG: FAD-dependent monooxygenase [Clostridia bacterium]|nr:FAD-dependent monooxygenase [Clostridia bacterium]